MSDWRVMPPASWRSLYRVVGLTLLVAGLVVVGLLSGIETRSAVHPATVYLGIHDDVGLRLAGMGVSLAVAAVGYWLWRAGGGEHRT